MLTLSWQRFGETPLGQELLWCLEMLGLCMKKGWMDGRELKCNDGITGGNTPLSGAVFPVRVHALVR